MQTIVLATQKGGSGKSTLAIGLALAAIQAGHTVRLIETDSQGTLSNWQSRRPYAEPIVEPVYVAGDVEQRLQTLAHDGVTLAIVDTAGGAQRRHHIGHSPCRSVPDPGAPEHRRHRGNGLHPQRHQGLEQAVRLHPEPDADPRSAPHPCGDHARR